MGIFEELLEIEPWEAYFAHKVEQGNLTRKELKWLREFIDSRAWLPVVQRFLDGEKPAPPRKVLISKAYTDKKRTVYTFAPAENQVLKLVSFLLRRYDGIFCDNLYSFRASRGVKRAAADVLRIRELDRRYVYKVDISNYFNTVDISLLLPRLENILWDDPGLYRFLKALLEDPVAIYEEQPVEEPKGVMAGVPVSTFLANVYLMEMDARFMERGVPYMRYSDDVIVFARTREEMEDCRREILELLNRYHLAVNPDKEEISQPGEPWVFLGFSYHKGVVDISPAARDKLKAKMRRKTRALARWAARKKLPGVRAAKAFVRRLNAKLYETTEDNELTWSRWYFPVINTDKTLKELDGYMCDCIRYLATGKRTKSRFDYRYEQIKDLGFRSMVHEFYRAKDEEKV